MSACAAFQKYTSSRNRSSIVTMYFPRPLGAPLCDPCLSAEQTKDMIVIDTERLHGRFSSLLSAGVPAASDSRRKGLFPTLIALSLALIGGAAYGQESPDLTSLSVDDLMNVGVTSGSRKGQKLSDTAAAVFGITKHDIRRARATSIREGRRS